MKVASSDQATTTLIFQAASERIFDHSRCFGFELLGFDYMVDHRLNTWLIEINTNPCLSTLSKKQDQLITKLLDDVFALAVDPLFGVRREPVGGASDFELIYSHTCTN